MIPVWLSVWMPHYDKVRQILRIPGCVAHVTSVSQWDLHACHPHLVLLARSKNCSKEAHVRYLSCGASISFTTKCIEIRYHKVCRWPGVSLNVQTFESLFLFVQCGCCLFCYVTFVSILPLLHGLFSKIKALMFRPGVLKVVTFNDSLTSNFGLTEAWMPVKCLVQFLLLVYALWRVYPQLASMN